jgi:CO dehydrogenase maturation factor
MKVVVTGKGGAGKTTVAAILARNLARGGANVVAVDADPNPNLGLALGLGMAMTASLDAVINVLVAEGAYRYLYDGDSDSPPGGDGEALLDRFGVVGPDGVRLVQTGRIERPSAGCLCCGSHLATRHMFADLHADDRVVLTDLEAGVLDLLWVKPEPDTVVLVVTNPDRGSLDVAAHSVAVSHDLKADRVIVIANRSGRATRPISGGYSPGLSGRGRYSGLGSEAGRQFRWRLRRSEVTLRYTSSTTRTTTVASRDLELGGNVGDPVDLVATQADEVASPITSRRARGRCPPDGRLAPEGQAIFHSDHRPSSTILQERSP